MITQYELETITEGQTSRDAVVDPTIEKLFASSNAASDRTASPVDMQATLFAALARMDEESTSSDSDVATPTPPDATSCHPCDSSADVTDLLLRVREGDSVAWEEIVRRYSPLVYAAVRSFRLQDADARDAVQMTWLRLAENVHRLQYPERLAGWLATTARRECLRILRLQAQQVSASVESAADDVVDPGTGPEQRAIERDTARALWELVDKLSPVRRSLLRALFADNPRSFTAIARSAGIPPGGIGPTRARALRQLRRRLDEHGLGPG